MQSKTLRMMIVSVVILFVSAVIYLIINALMNKNSEKVVVTSEGGNLSISAIRKEMLITDKLNNSLSKDEIFLQEDEYLGFDSRNNHMIVRSSRCSDLCPDNAYLGLFYDEVTEENCVIIEGEVVRDPAWKGYSGCAPVIE